jgi:hypothetical protein
MEITKDASQAGKHVKVRRILIAIAACGLISSALGAESVQAAKHVKSTSYTYCDFEKNGSGSVCFTPAFVVVKKTLMWRFDEEPNEVSGTFTVTGKSYVFRETRPEQRTELRGTKGKHGVISGTLYENGEPSEFTFTLTKR